MPSWLLIRYNGESVKKVKFKNANTGDVVRLELLPGIDSTFSKPRVSYMTAGDTLKMCLRPFDPELDKPISVSQNPTTCFLEIKVKPFQEVNIFSTTHGYDLDTWVADATGRIDIDVNNEWGWWVPDSDVLRIYLTSDARVTVDFTIRVIIEGWVEQYRAISRELLVSALPNSEYIVYNDTTGEITNTGLITTGYSDPYTQPVEMIPFDPSKFSAGDKIKVVNRINVSGTMHDVVISENEYVFIEFDEAQVTELTFDNWYTDVGYDGPQLRMNTGNVTIYAETIDPENILRIYDNTFEQDRETNSQIQFRPRYRISSGEHLRFRMIAVRNNVAIDEVRVVSATWFSGIPVIGSQMVEFASAYGISSNTRFLIRAENVPSVLPPTLKNIGWWFFHYVGGDADVWAKVNNWDTSHIEIFDSVFAYSSVYGPIDLSGWSFASATSTTDMGLSSNVTIGV